MKSIKSILVLFVAVLLTSATTYAQRPTGQRADRANKMVEMMTEELGLSDTQIEQIAVIQNEFTEKMRAMRGNTNGDRNAMRDEMQKTAKERETAIDNILTEEQRTKWVEVKAQNGKRPGTEARPMKRPKGERPEMNGSKRPTIDGGKQTRGIRDRNKADRLQKVLDLSDTQAKELKQLTRAHQAKVKELKADGKERKIKKVSKKYNKAVKKLLSAEQFEKWTAMKANKKNVQKDILK